MPTVIEKFRELIVKDIINTKSFKTDVWLNHWNPWIRNFSNQYSNINDVRKLGENFNELFHSTKGKITTGFKKNSIEDVNSIKSRSGTAWQCILVWYLNLLALGSGYVILPRKKRITPEPIYDGTSTFFYERKSGKGTRFIFNRN